MARARIGAGKFTADVKTLVDENTKDELMRLANLDGVSLSEYVRDLIFIHVHGREHLVRLHRARIERMAGIAQEED